MTATMTSFEKAFYSSKNSYSDIVETVEEAVDNSYYTESSYQEYGQVKSKKSTAKKVLAIIGGIIGVAVVVGLLVAGASFIIGLIGTAFSFFGGAIIAIVSFLVAAITFIGVILAVLIGIALIAFVVLFFLPVPIP